MLKRLWWLTVGFLLGLGSSFAFARRLRRAIARYAPAEVAERWSGHAQGLGRDVRDALTVGRDAMRAREAELRRGLDAPGAGVRGRVATLPDAGGAREAGQ
jgi:hypothetical protein